MKASAPKRHVVAAGVLSGVYGPATASCAVLRASCPSPTRGSAKAGEAPLHVTWRPRINGDFRRHASEPWPATERDVVGAGSPSLPRARGLKAASTTLSTIASRLGYSKTVSRTMSRTRQKQPLRTPSNPTQTPATTHKSPANSQLRNRRSEVRILSGALHDDPAPAGFSRSQRPMVGCGSSPPRTGCSSMAGE